MPQFLITSHGKQFQITAPDQDTAMKAFAQTVGAPDQTEAPAPAAPPVETKGDNYVSQGLSGFNEGLGKTLGLPVDALTGIINGGMSGSNMLFHTDFKPIEHPVLGSESINDFQRSMGMTTPESADPGKQFVRRVAQEFGASAMPSVGLAAKAARPLAMLANEVLLTGASGTGAATADQISGNNPWADLAGEILGSASAGGVQRLMRRAVTPFPASASRVAAADALKAEGVDLTAGQRTGSKGLQYAESELGGAKIADLTEKQAEQFTSAALSKAGISARRATPDVIDGALKDFNTQYRGLEARNQIVADATLGKDLSDAVTTYRGLIPGHQSNYLDGMIGDLVSSIQQNGGTLPGPAYQAFRSRYERLAQGAKADPQLSGALRDIKDALDAAMTRSMVATKSPDLGTWQQLNKDYRNFLAIEKASAGAGSQTAAGLISPAALRQAVVSTHGRRAYVSGRDDFSELAHAGNEAMTPLPQSGTAPRLAVRGMHATVPAVVGGILGNGALPGVGAVAGAMAGAAVPHLAGQLMLSKVGKRYLANQLLKRARPQGNGVGVVAAALANQESAQIDSPQARIAQALLQAGASP